MFSAWILGIVGVICLGILLETVLPEGQTGKYVKGAFSLLVVFVIVSPLPALAGALKDWNPDFGTISADEDFAAKYAAAYAEGKECELEGYLAALGYESDVKVVVKEGSLSKIDKTEVILYLSVLEKDEENTHISKAAEEACRRLKVSREAVSVKAVFVRENADGSS